MKVKQFNPLIMFCPSCNGICFYKDLKSKFRWFSVANLNFFEYKCLFLLFLAECIDVMLYNWHRGHYHTINYAWASFIHAIVNASQQCQIGGCDLLINGRCCSGDVFVCFSRNSSIPPFTETDDYAEIIDEEDTYTMPSSKYGASLGNVSIQKLLCFSRDWILYFSLK